MTSKVELANIALANIRAQSINSFGEASLNGQYVRLFYPKVLKSMLTDHNWSFGRKEKPLARLSNEELFDYAYVYQYPSDCLRLNYLKSPVNKIDLADNGFVFRPEYYDNNPFNDESARRLRIPHAVRNIDGNRVIGANEPDLWIDYRAFVDDPNKYDASFIDAFTWRLGSELAIPIIGGDVGRAERQNCLAVASEMTSIAMAEDMNQNDTGMEGGIAESDFILSRN